MTNDDGSSSTGREDFGAKNIPSSEGESVFVSSLNGEDERKPASSHNLDVSKGLNHPREDFETLGESGIPRAHKRKRNKKRRHVKYQNAPGPTHVKKPQSYIESECDDHQDATAKRVQISEREGQVLSWHSPMPHVPLEVEEAMIEVLVRWKKKERGMFKNQPDFRLDQLKKKLRQNGGQMLLSQALSLRRHHMKLLNPGCPMSKLGLGQEGDIRECARLFEKSVEDFLVGKGILLWTEEQQKEDFRKRAKNGELLQHTPDFLVPHGGFLHIRKTLNNVDNQCGSEVGTRVLEEKSIRWLEVKMFYGASTIPHGSKGAVGSIMATAKRYLKEFGPGAILFMYGCGARLADDLTQAGVLVLDCSGGFVPLEAVYQHQRTWCANKKGEILP